MIPPPNLLAVRAVQRWLSWPRRLAWHLRPKFLKFHGKPVRLKWWLCAHFVYRIEPKIQPRLMMARKLMYRHHDGGRSDPHWMEGKRMAEDCRRREALIYWLAMEAGPQHTDGSSTVDLMFTAGRVR